MTIFKIVYCFVINSYRNLSNTMLENFLNNVKIHIEKLIDYIYINFSSKTITFLKYLFISIIFLIIIYLLISAFAELLLLGILFILYLIYRKL